MTVLGRRKRDRRNNRTELGIQEPGCSAISAPHITNAHARGDLSAPGNALDQIEDRFFGGLVAALPQAMVNMLAPDFAIVAVQFVVVVRDLVTVTGHEELIMDSGLRFTAQKAGRATRAVHLDALQPTAAGFRMGYRRRPVRSRQIVRVLAGTALRRLLSPSSSAPPLPPPDREPRSCRPSPTTLSRLRF